MSLPIATWRLRQREAFTDWHKLADYLQLDDQQKEQILVEHKHFPLLLPVRLAKRIAKGTLDDPILRQFLPLKKEEKESEGYTNDPVGESAMPVNGRLLHKYQGRVLIAVTSACAMHCRYCFRRHYDYPEGNREYSQELLAIEADSSIREVVLSGGDPLSLSNNTLRGLLQGLDSIPHVRRIRFHSRFPIGIPERIDEELVSILGDLTTQVVFILHINHPSELGNDLFHAIKQLQTLGIPVLNQAVLLREVNDDIDTLTALCEELADHGILPYYLHQLDPVAGASHFAVPETKGQELVDALRGKISGYAVPTYVKEEVGAPSKTAINSTTFRSYR